MAEHRVLSMVLAGGEGKRLAPLTADRAKPAVPFAGQYRIIDFVLSNLANAGYLRIVVLTQYKSHSLDLHVTRTWRLSTLLNQYVTPVPAQMRRGPRWFAGSADAVYQNLNLVGDEQPEHILVLGADHIYRMDPRQMVDAHVESGAGVTVAAIPVPIEQAGAFGVIEQGPGSTIRAFREKPSVTVGMPGSPGQVLASMGIYVFRTETLIDAVVANAADEQIGNDIGGDIIPALVQAGDAHVYDFSENRVPGATARDRAYWRDVGSLDSYYDSHIDLISVEPVFNLYNRHWPILTSGPTALPPAKFVLEGPQGSGQAFDSMVCGGAIIAGGTVRRSVIGPGVQIEPGALVEDSIIMNDTVVGAGAVVRRSILDKNVVVPTGAAVGVDLDHDRRYYEVSDNGIVVLGKGQRVEP